MTKKKEAPSSERPPRSDTSPANEPASNVDAPEVVDAKAESAMEFVTIAYPLPPSGPSIEELLQLEAELVIKAKPERGRWRAGRFFTREESFVPLGELADKLDLLTGDPELVVAVRVPKQR